MADPTAYILYLQRTVGNQAVNQLLKQRAAPPPPVQRAIWQRNLLTGTVEQIHDGPGTYAVPTNILQQVLGPGDRYDDATSLVLRLSGETVPITTLVPLETLRGASADGDDHAMDAEGAEEATPAVDSGVRRPFSRESLLSSERLARGMTEGRKQRLADRTKRTRAEDRAANVAEAREEPLEAPADPAMTAQLDSQGQPELVFQAGDEVHHLYATPAGQRFRLMIASVPLPIADFILEMANRYEKLKRWSQDTAKRLVKKLGYMNKTLASYAIAKPAADAELITADAVFANALSTTNAKLLAEENLAKALNRLIALVTAFAVRLGKHMNTPGNAKMGKAKDPSFYTKKMAGAVERYRIEGLVARYQEQPDYSGSDFERDHQPHNDLIETMAALPEFTGKKLKQVAAGRTLLGWSIMLHHDRHAAGRTYGNKGGTVTADFLNALSLHRAALGAPNPATTRQFCIDYLVQSLKDDVAQLKVVANNGGYYGDVTAAVTDAANKVATKAGVAADPLVTATAVTAKQNEVKAQILAGEDRMLATESEVKEYDK